MRQKMKITKEIAHQIYDILAQAQAHPDDRDSFVYHTQRGCHEYRFIGNLGFGGKFWNSHDDWYVSCYQEEETPYRLTVINTVNQQLEQLRNKLVSTP